VPQSPHALPLPVGAEGVLEVSQVLVRFSPCMPRPDDSGGPPGPHLGGPFVSASTTRTVSPSASTLNFGAVPGLGERDLPYGLHGSLSTLRAGRSALRSPSFLASFQLARLGTGGWLGLSWQGLPPCKKRQACLAHTGLKLTGAAVMPLSAGALDAPVRDARPPDLPRFAAPGGAPGY